MMLPALVPEFVTGRVLFAVDISQVSFISYDTATGNQHVAMWPPGREFIRRATSATSVGDPEPVADLVEIS